VPAEYVDLPIYHEELAAALGFTSADLEANRAGRLSAAQRTFWFRQHVSRAAGSAAVCLLLAAGCVALAFAIGIGYQLAWAILVLAALILFLGGYLAVVTLNLSQDLNAGLISSVEGLVQPSVEVSNMRTVSYLPAMPLWTFFWVVGDQRFWVSGKAYGVLTPARHRLYFLPRTRRVVAAEPSGTGQSAGLSPAAVTRDA
jgi:hypothetical protein